MSDAAEPLNRAPEPTTADYEAFRARGFAHFLPPPKLRTADWIEENVYLPSDVSATPGRMRLHSWQRQFCDAVDAPDVWRCTFVKPARIGATALLVAIAASYTKNDPCPILCIQPTESDARDFMVGTVDSTFAASPSLRGLINRDDTKAKDRQILTRRFPGGSFKCVSPVPRNLRRHTVRVLLLDESSAYESSPEGSPISLALKRTLSYSNRRVVETSTPTDEHCNVLKSYAESDQRKFFLSCPMCSEEFEPTWECVRWDKDSNGAHLPETAHMVCPHCGGVIEEKLKPAMVDAGRWRATAPHVKGHAGFKTSALISTLPNASWSEIVREFLAAKNDPTLLRVWRNTLLGEPFTDQSGEGLDEHTLAARAEPFGINAIPADVRVLTMGVDVQAYGLECVTIGHSATQMLILSYETIHAPPTSDVAWQELDGLLRRRFAHPLGGSLGYDAAAVDSGDGNVTDICYAFTKPRAARRIFSIKSYVGNRPMIERSAKPFLYLVGHDACKSRLFALLEREGHIRFSADLPARYYEELCSERRVIHYAAGQPKKRWERIKGARAEALDSTCYGMAVAGLVRVDLTQRENELRQIAKPQTLASYHPSKFVSGER